MFFNLNDNQSGLIINTKSRKITHELNPGTNIYFAGQDEKSFIIETKNLNFQNIEFEHKLNNKLTIKTKFSMKFEITHLKILCEWLKFVEKLTDEKSLKKEFDTLLIDFLSDKIGKSIEFYNQLTFPIRNNNDYSDLVEDAFATIGIKIQQLIIHNLEYPTEMKANEVGFLFEDNKFSKVLTPGVIHLNAYSNIDFKKYTDSPISLSVSNQEVLTKDNIALRFSYYISFKLADANKFVAYFDVLDPHLKTNIETIIHNQSQISLRNSIAEFEAKALNENRNTVTQDARKSLEEFLAEKGLELIEFSIKDITFPKLIQEVFAETLRLEVEAEAKINSARAQVAAARALKNASEITNGSPEIKFERWLQTLEKIAKEGGNTFQITQEPQT